MKRGFAFLITIGIMTVLACGTKEHSKSADKISGTYVWEYSFKVVNPETGAEIGMRMIRDTIFIEPIENGYEVSNRKWRLNDYDKNGWQSMEHSDDRPMVTFLCTFDLKSNALINSEHRHVLYLDLIRVRLYKEPNRINFYSRAR